MSVIEGSSICSQTEFTCVLFQHKAQCKETETRCMIKSSFMDPGKIQECFHFVRGETRR